MKKMPVAFIGHGSPLNITNPNEFTKGWKDLANYIPRPDSILSISAHWTTENCSVSTNPFPETMHDYFAFPPELYEINYKATGASSLGNHVYNLLDKKPIKDSTRGLDHGTWMPLLFMYPNSDIPVCQLSIQEKLSPTELFELGNKLKKLRSEGVLIIGSGNVVHNMSQIDYQLENGGYDWAYSFDNSIKNGILNKDISKLKNFDKLNHSNKAVPYNDHFIPLLYVLGATYSSDTVQIFNDKCVLGSISMTSYLFDEKQH